MSAIYPAALHEFVVGNLDVEGDPIGVLLVGENFEFRETDIAVDDIAGAEISGGGYARQVCEITTERAGTSLVIRLGGMSWQPVTLSAIGAVYYREAATDSEASLIAFVKFDGTVRTVDGLLTLTASAIRMELANG
jgi:hypothetical protein